MGKAKNSDSKTFTLTDREFNYLKMLAICLNYNTAQQKIISGFLSYVAHNRLGLAEGTDLQFEIDLDKEEGPHELIVKAIAPQVVEQ